MTDDERFEAYKEALASTRRELLAAIPKPDSPIWKTVSILLPILMTSILGFVVFYAQAKLQASITDATQVRLALSQDYLQERLKTYKGSPSTGSRTEEFRVGQNASNRRRRQARRTRKGSVRLVYRQIDIHYGEFAPGSKRPLEQGYRCCP